MLAHQFMPAVSGYTKTLADTITAKKAAVSAVACKAEVKQLESISASYDKLYALYEKLVKDTVKAEKEADVLKAAKFYKDTVIKDMDDIREIADALEEIVPEDVIPYPSYGKILFYMQFRWKADDVNVVRVPPGKNNRGERYYGRNFELD